jgi:3-deoxy-D-manno-octulosonate 8-phosphate phosphatase (KDO 8-P phosphatase)
MTFKTIRALALDVDGVLTDGGVWWGPDDGEWKRFHFADIMGVSLARKAGLLVALISGEDSPLVDRFAAKLNLDWIAKGRSDKAAALKEFAAQFALPLHEIAFIGDDVNDLGAMALAGWSAAPANAQPSVKARVDYIAQRSGGDGAVREVVDRLLAVEAPPVAVSQPTAPDCGRSDRA